MGMKPLIIVLLMAIIGTIVSFSHIIYQRPFVDAEEGSRGI